MKIPLFEVIACSIRARRPEQIRWRMRPSRNRGAMNGNPPAIRSVSLSQLRGTNPLDTREADGAALDRKTRSERIS
jgi:hypothetical protein